METRKYEFILTPCHFAAFLCRHKCPGYESKLEKILRHSKCCKARLLHYFPMDDDGNDDSAEVFTDDTQFSSWCGWHNDHGSLTGLIPALYLDTNGNIIPCPDGKAGLYIKSRTGELVHATIPDNAIAFQVGETAQIHTGGWLQATPHGEYNVSLISLAVTMLTTTDSFAYVPYSRERVERSRKCG